MARIGMMLVVVSVAAAGCGTRTTGPAPQPVPASTSSPVTTVVNGVDVAEPAEIAGPETTSTTEPPITEPGGSQVVALDEVDSMLSDIDDTLAELDQLLNEAAAALAAEEGEIIP